MKTLVTGSAGHLGEGVMRTLRDEGRPAVGLDIEPSDYTDVVGSISDVDNVAEAMKGVTAVIHAATLHKPHVATHSWRDFIDVNVTGTSTLLEAARGNGVSAFVFTSTTSAFGDALAPGPGEPAAWITEDVPSQPKNIYGATKIAAEHLCKLAHRKHKTPIVILRTSRFFPEDDDNAEVRSAFDQENAKVNELLNRRVDIEDAVSAHLLAIERAGDIGFGSFIISATAPFERADAALLRTNAPAVVRRYADFDDIYEARGWRMFDSLDRVYDNTRARQALGWRPRYDFSSALAALKRGDSPFSPLAAAVGSKGYHDRVFEDGPFPVE
ncbi:MAG: NAD(P)-dependent oxidoreductase [Pseudomonadota bacterium]